MSRIEKNKLNFTVALIAEFAATYQIKQKQAFNYLNRFKQKTDQLQSGDPCVTIFELEDQIIKTSDLQIKIFDDYCEEWAQFVLLNRDRSHTHPAHTYDIVIGPIADDGVTYQLRRYSMGDISMSRLIEELKYAKGLTIQYYFGTEHALSYLKKL